MEFTVGARTDVGLKRSHNEDSLCADTQVRLFVVCDGMGGCNAGEVASQLALDVIHHHIREAHANKDLPLIGQYDPRFSLETNRLATAIHQANATVYESGSSRPEYDGMGTTVVAALLNGSVASIAHVGDSRVYLARGYGLTALTTDHSLVAEQIRRGLLTEAEAERSPQRHIITRALGVQPTVEVALNETVLTRDDALLLCSDGLTRGVTPTEILKVIRGAQNAEAAAQDLITLANEAGGEDNTTVIVIMTHNRGAQELWRRVSNWVMS